MQIVSSGDNLHEISKPIFWGKYFKMLSAEKYFREIFLFYQENVCFVY